MLKEIFFRDAVESRTPLSISVVKLCFFGPQSTIAQLGSSDDRCFSIYLSTTLMSETPLSSTLFFFDVRCLWLRGWTRLSRSSVGCIKINGAQTFSSAASCYRLRLCSTKTSVEP